MTRVGVKWRELMRRFVKELSPYDEVYQPEVRNGHSRIYYRMRDAADSRTAEWAWRVGALLALCVAIFAVKNLNDHIVSLTGTIANKEASRGTGDQRSERHFDGPARGDDR